jgi:putative transposase
MRRRKQIRLKEYDYSLPGGYFVTVCTKERRHLFGEIIEGEMHCNICGVIAKQCWNELSLHFSNIELSAFVVMPNHVHGIIIITDDHRRGLINQTSTENKWIIMKNPKTTLGKIIRTYKAKASHMIHGFGAKEFNWQRGYYDHVIRNEKSLNRIREYIATNPERWYRDEDNSECEGIDESDANPSN